MKKLFIVLIVLVKAIPLAAQPGLRIKAGASFKLTNGAFVVLNNASIINDGSIQQTANSGTFKFAGISIDTIKGNGTFVFDRLQLAKGTDSWIVLNSNVQVLTQLNFTGGLLDLDNYIVDLGGSGTLTNESEISRATCIGNGYLRATATLNNPNAINPGNLGAVITSSANLGSTIIRRGHAQQTGINGSSNSIKRYYDLSPTNNTTLNATLRLNYFDAELNSLAETALVVWRRTGTSWASLSSTSQDTAANYVEKKSIQNFDRVTLAAGCPTISLVIPDVYAVTPGGSANTLYIGYGPASLTLSAQKSGGTAPYTYKWTAGSPGGSSVGADSFLVVTPTATGSYTYYLTVNDAYGCKTVAVSKTIIVKDIRCGKKLDMVTICQKQTNGTYQTNCVTSSKVQSELTNGSSLDSCQSVSPAITQRTATNPLQGFTAQVYPNPSNGYFTLVTRSTNLGTITITITDDLGRQVQQLKNQQGNGKLSLGNYYRPGIYFIEIKQGDQTKTIKLIKLVN
jgi:Secretion system C-terminal sorting domain